MEKVRYGIIGMGNMGSAHLDTFYSGKIENGVCVALADLKDSKIKSAIEKCPGEYEVYASGAELIEKANVDAIIIAVPHYDHPTLAIQALNKGIHVICEKPAGVYTKQVREMNEVAEKANSRFTLMYNQRTNPLYIKMHDIIKNGELGSVKRLNWIITNWFRTQYYYDSGAWRATWRGEGGGVLMNQCPHQLDLLQWICGMMPTRVRAFCHFGKWHDMETEDDVTAYLEFPNGATGAFITTTADTPGTNRLEIIGTKGKLVCEKDVLQFYKLETDCDKYLIEATSGFSEPEYTVETFEQIPEKNTRHAGIINNFSNAILGIEPQYVDGKEGMHCVQLINAMLLSSWKNDTVSIPVNEDEYLAELEKRIKTSRMKEECEEKAADQSITFGATN